MNPWDFVLMLEGALLFAGTATRRLESSDASILSYPFTVRTTGTGAGCGDVADEAPSRAEIWMPLWNKAISAQELRVLLSEGRVTVGRRAARDGLDFARAVGGYGVDRGISSFQRYAFLMRSGKAYLATPLARIKVFRNPQVDLVTHLDRGQWLERLRRFSRDKNAPSSIQQLVRRLEDEIFSLTRGADRAALQGILILLGQIHQSCACSKKTQDGEKGIKPVPILGAEWALEADDNSHEFRLACALAGLTEMRGNLFPLKENKGRIEWNAGSSRAVWGGGNLVANLLRVLDRRMLDTQRSDTEDKPLAGLPAANLAAVLAFLRGETDDERIAGLLAGLVNVKLPQHLPRREISSDLPPAVFGLLKPLFTPEAILQKLGLLPSDGRLPLPREVVTLLKTGNREQVNRAIGIAWRRLRIAGLKLPSQPRQPPDFVGIDSSRLVAALMIPLSIGDHTHVCQPFTPIQKAD
jgi:CRISPR-associated protein Csx17